MSYGNQPPYPPQQPGPPPPQGGWSPPTSQYTSPGYPAVPPRKNRNPLIIAVAVSVVVVFCMLIGAVGILAGGEDDPTAGTATVRATTGQEVDGLGATATAAPTDAPPTSKPAPAATTAPTVKTVTMPKVTGENAAVADDRLRKLGFTNIQYGSQDRDDTVVLLLSNWTVTKQSTQSGKKIPTDTLIVLTCTKQG